MSQTKGATIEMTEEQRKMAAAYAAKEKEQ